MTSKLKIKTSKEIIDTQCSTWGTIRDLENHLNKKWISVDDLQQWIKNNMSICCNNFHPTIQADDLIEALNNK